MKNLKIAFLFLSGLFLFLSCNNQDEITSLEIKTTSVSLLFENKIECKAILENFSGKKVIEKGFYWSTDSLFNSDAANWQKSDVKSDTFSIKSTKSLFPATKYYIKSYVTTEEGTNYGNTLTVKTDSNRTSYYIDSRDNKKYKIVYIGGKWWFAENLNFEIEGSTKQQDKNTKLYNRFYTWDAAKSACPQDCKLPTDNDWMKLELAIGMTSEQLIDFNWRGWNAAQLLTGGIQGFNVNYIGYLTPVSQGSTNSYFDITCRFWTGTENNDGAYYRAFDGLFNYCIYRSVDDKKMQYSVRYILN